MNEGKPRRKSVLAEWRNTAAGGIESAEDVKARPPRDGRSRGMERSGLIGGAALKPAALTTIVNAANQSKIPGRANATAPLWGAKTHSPFPR